MRARRSWVLVGVVAGVLASCGADGQTDDTMAPIEGAPGDTGGAPATTTAAATSTMPAAPGSGGPKAGFVSVTVQVASAGIDETLALDRASVATPDPLNLDATCSALDGGDPVALSVIDLRRLSAGSQLVSIALRTEEPATAPGEHAAQLEMADAEQLTTSFDVTLTLDEGGRAGTFEGSDEAGNRASGSFVCADQPVETTTTAPLVDAAEELPADTTG